MASLCPHCLEKVCKKHPLFDHGERERRLKSMLPSSTASINEKIQLQIARLQKEQQGTSFDESDSHRTVLDNERDKLIQKSTSSSRKRSLNMEKTEQLIRSGLNPSVAATMVSDSDSDSVSDSDAYDTGSNESETSSLSSHDRKRQKSDRSKKSKKDKKSKEKEKKKKRKKEIKKREKKSRKE